MHSDEFCQFCCPGKFHRPSLTSVCDLLMHRPLFIDLTGEVPCSIPSAFLMVKFKLRYNTCLFLSDSGSIRKNIKFQYYKRQYKIWPKCITVQCKTHYLYAFIFLMMCKLLEKMLSAPRAKQKNNLQIKVVINILTRRIGLGVGLVGWTREFRLEQMSDLYRTSSKDLGKRLK